ncbi:MAG: RNA polymerase sigma factor [Saprospiraceae bacterium]|nr:RNA polymerase sigma factor [Saprospiraceae bacterium]
MILEQELKLLINGCLDNDRSCQRKFFDLTSDRVMTTCRRYCSNQDDARDLFQETYLKIFKYLESYKMEDGDIHAWIYRITKNCIITHFHSRKIVFSPLEEVCPEDDIIVQFDQSNFQEEEILKEIQSLPEGYRTILNLYVFESLEHMEIAAALNISESTSRSQLSRARKLLKKKLESLYTTNYEKFII